MAGTKVDGNLFLDPEAASLATVIVALESAEPDAPRRGEMASALRTVCRVLGYSPHELPADTALLGRLIRKAMPAAAGVSPSRWANARSLLLAALKRSGLAIMPGRRLHPLSPAWAALAATLRNRYERAMLSRLMRWASAENIDPEHLDQAAADRFGTALMQDSFHENPRDCWRRTVVAWNAAVEGMPGWPQQQFSPPPGPERYVLALEAFPASFLADVQAWLDRLAGKTGLDAGPIKPLRPVTIDKWHFALRQLGSALVASGRDIATITRLEDLVEAADAILRFYLERAGNQPCAQTAALAAHLKAIARHHVGVPGPFLDRLRRMAARVTPPVQGMTSKNRTALRQFQSVEMQRKLAQLPATLFAALPASGPVGKRLAIRLQGALAVEILLVAPMRLRNLCRLELGRHVQELRHGRRSRWLIAVPGDEVKNGEPIELPMPERSVRLLEIYRARILPVLGQPGRHFLFPGRNGAKAEVTLGGRSRGCCSANSASGSARTSSAISSATSTCCAIPMAELEAEKAALEERLAAPEPLKVRLHPNLAGVYRQKVAALEQALADPEIKAEAMEIVRSQIGRITLTPREGGGLAVALQGDLARILQFCEMGEHKHQRPGRGVPGRGLSVVAGGGFEPPTFRL